jgi:hypothetical protein
MEVLYRRSFDREQLAERYPPRFVDRNKRAFVEMVEGPPVPGTIKVARWSTDLLPGKRSGWRPGVVPREGYFSYNEGVRAGEMHWHLNFANFDLFSAYGGKLLAQDEMQVLEHPDLARVRHALAAAGLSTLVTDQRLPTPFTLAGVPRRGALDTSPGPGRPEGLYGNRFAAASPDEVRAAATRLDPPTISNIVAMEAPAYGVGEYSPEDITRILRTAFTGFGAAVEETRRLAGDAATVIHTGWWGCGAYGGNPELMAALQLIAAEWAHIDVVHFFVGDPGGLEVLDRARSVVAAVPAPLLTPDLVSRIAARRYLWGVGDGN